MKAFFVFILLGFAVSSCGGGASVDPFSRKRVDGKIPVQMDLIREQVHKELAGLPEEIATKERWQVIENDFNYCRLSSKETDKIKAQEVFNLCMSDKGYLYLDPLNAERLHGEIYDKLAEEKERQEKEAAEFAVKAEKERKADELRRQKDVDLILAARGNTEKVRALLKSGANPNAKDNEGFTALMKAASNNHVEIAKILLEAGANPNAKNNEGDTALIKVAFPNHAEIAKVLLEARANPNAKDRLGRTALIIASAWGRVETANILLEAGANPNAKSNEGWTSLMSVAFHGLTEIAKVLLEVGANPNLKNNEGQTALTIAQGRGYAEIVKMLKDVGAN